MDLLTVHPQAARLAADAVLVLHALFVAWVMLGGLVVLVRPWAAALHLPAAAWGVWIQWSGGLCPLTPLENALRARAGQGGYDGGFVEHYLVPLVYPDALTREMQWGLGALVLAVNLVVYAAVLRRRRRGAR
jgi:Protein of Unknown function (DUF2784)